MTGWREIPRTTPMPLTLRLVAVFTAISIAGFGATWWLADREFREATKKPSNNRSKACPSRGCG